MPVALFEGDLPRSVLHTLKAQPHVAVDTETGGLSWSTDELFLCQLFTATTGPILLRNVTGTPNGLASLMSDPDVIKVMHHAPFDLRFLEAKWGIRSASIACTKAASKLLTPLSPHEDHSLKAVLLRYLGVQVEKGAVRTSDWGAPALSQEQLAYAVQDVAHLVNLHRVMAGQLGELELLDLYSEICAYMPIDAHLEVSGIPNPLTY